jgi:hypothetical protein
MFFRLDLEFLPKDLLYNNKNYSDSHKNLMDAIDILEKAQNQQFNETPKTEPHAETSFWSKILNPFKCGKD